MKLVLAAIAAFAFAVPASASAAQNPCDHNPTDLCDNVVVTVEQPTAAECPAGGLVLVVGGVRYPVCNGLPGTPGAAGEPGNDGNDAATGATGPAGANGATGAAGVSGVSGLDGADAVAVPIDPAIRTVVAQPRRTARAAKCERRLNKRGRLVVVCKPMTCPRRASKADPRRLVVKCPPARKHGKR